MILGIGTRRADREGEGADQDLNEARRVIAGAHDTDQVSAKALTHLHVLLAPFAQWLCRQTGMHTVQCFVNDIDPNGNYYGQYSTQFQFFF